MDDVYTSQEADRLSRIMYNDPHSAASEMREQLMMLRPDDAVALIRKTKDYEFQGSMGSLNIRAEIDQNGCDSGYRNVTMFTQDGPEQIAEFKARPASCPDGYADNGYYARPGYNVDPLAAITGFIVGDLLWQQQRGRERFGGYDDDSYWAYRQREQWREREWREHQGEFQQQWRNPNFRNDYYSRDRDGWQQNAFNNQWNPFRAQLPPQIVQQPDRHIPRVISPPVIGMPGGNFDNHRQNPGTIVQPGQNWHQDGDGRRYIQPVVPPVGNNNDALRQQQEQQRRLQEQAEQQRRLQEQAEQQRRLQEQAEQQRRQQQAQPPHGFVPPPNWQQQQQRPLPTPGGRFEGNPNGVQGGNDDRAAQIRQMQQQRIEREAQQKQQEAEARARQQQAQQQQLEEARRRQQEALGQQLQGQRERQQQPGAQQQIPPGVNPEVWRRQHHQ